MKREDRRAAISAYKERARVAGIYAVRCEAADACWVGKAADIDAVKNRLWFSLAQGTEPRRALQAAWSAHGANAMTFEILERIAVREGETPLAHERRLKEGFAAWRERLGAEGL